MSRNATMRIAVLSDLHGNLLALEAVLADLRRRGPFDQIVVAGDLVWSGPWPAEVVDRVRALNAVVIQGNTDAFFCRTADNPPAGKQEERFAAHLTWMRERLGPERVRYLASLPFSHRISPAPGGDLLVVHANPTDYDRPISPHISDAELDELLLVAGHEPDWRALAFGHLHIPFIRRWRGRLLVNVASVGLPLDGDPRAAYAILTWDGALWQAEHHRVDYEVPVVAYHMRHSGMPRGAHFAERLMAARSGPGMPAAMLMAQ
jgi:predicted phosphodiesterase